MFKLKAVYLDTQESEKLSHKLVLEKEIHSHQKYE